MVAVISLHPREAVEPIVVDKTGDKKNLANIYDSADDMAEQLFAASVAFVEGPPARLACACQRLSITASALGLDNLARVAANVITILKGYDFCALGAVMGRMMRLGEGALSHFYGSCRDTI